MASLAYRSTSLSAIDSQNLSLKALIILDHLLILHSHQLMEYISSHQSKSLQYFLESLVEPTFERLDLQSLLGAGKIHPKFEHAPVNASNLLQQMI